VSNERLRYNYRSGQISVQHSECDYRTYRYHYKLHHEFCFESVLSSDSISTVITVTGPAWPAGSGWCRRGPLLSLCISVLCEALWLVSAGPAASSGRREGVEQLCAAAGVQVERADPERAIGAV